MTALGGKPPGRGGDLCGHRRPTRARTCNHPLVRPGSVVGVDAHAPSAPYEPLTLHRLATLLTDSDEARRWRLIAEFLEEYSWEPAETRAQLLADEPPGSGDERWDVFLAALAEHLAAVDNHSAPGWADGRSLRRFWFPFNTRAARVDAIVHAPAAFRRRGVFIAPQELKVA